MTPIAPTSPPKGRSPHRLPIILTARDRDVLAELLDSRILTLAQLADIHFDGRREAAKKRLQSLKRARLVGARPRLTRSEREGLRITRDGFDWLAESGRLADMPRLTWNTMTRRLKVSPLTLRHELMVGDVKAAIHRAVRGRADTKVTRFVTWPRMLRFKLRGGQAAQQSIISPDGFFRIEQLSPAGRTGYDFFVEVDRSTESLSRIVTRAAGYLSHYTQGDYARRRGGKDSDPKAFPFRVLWIVPSRARAEGFARACLEHRPPILKMMWIATIHDVLADPLGSIWIRPVDLQDQRRQPLLPTA
jgi:hypothetical protein